MQWKTQENYRKQISRQIYKRKKDILKWIMFSYVVFSIVAPCFHYFRWSRMTDQGRVGIVF